MEARKHVFWEVLLIVGSVFVFRALWLLLDKFRIFDGSTTGLLINFIFGLVIISAAFYVLKRHY